MCDGLRFFVERDDSGVALHGHAVDAAFNGEFAVLVEGLQGAEFAIEGGGLLGALDAHVDFGDGFGGDHVGAGSSANHAGIHRQSLLQVGELGDGGDLAGEFEDGAVSFAGIESGVGGNAFDGQGVVADTFARGLDGAAKSGGRLHDKDGGGFAGESLGGLAGRSAADFFVGDEEDGDGAGQAVARFAGPRWRRA